MPPKYVNRYGYEYCVLAPTFIVRNRGYRNKRLVQNNLFIWQQKKVKRMIYEARVKDERQKVENIRNKG
ncbi:hypothetical protein FHG87_025958, partial [Trinorchestia longiramus]